MARYVGGYDVSEYKKKFREDLDILMYSDKTCDYCGAQFDHMNHASHPQFTCGTISGWDGDGRLHRTKKCVENELKTKVLPDNLIKDGYCVLCYSKWLSKGEIIHDRSCLLYLAKKFGIEL